MKQLSGIWWAFNQPKVTGKLEITEENKIILTTYGKLYDTNVICGFAEGEKITLVDVRLDRTDIYENVISKDEDYPQEVNENIKLEYCTYKYTAGIAIFGYIYERKGDMRIKELSLYYTNLEKWIDWPVEIPEASTKDNEICLKIKKDNEKRIKTGKFDVIVRNPYLIEKSVYKMQIRNQVEIAIENIQNEYIKTTQGIIECLQAFLILCTGDNINIEKIRATDFFNRNIEIILGYGKSNYNNRSIIKDIIKYKDVEENLENIINVWMKVYEENELLMANFCKLQATEDMLVSEYMNLMSAIDSLHLLVIHKNQSKEPCAEIVKKLLRETNFILNLSEQEIEELAVKVKDIRRYFVHSNKTQKQIVHNNVSIVKSIMSILIEAIRSRIMIEIGIDKKILENYYGKIENLKKVKYDIVNNINEDEIVVEDKYEDGGKRMNLLSKKEKDDIAELNAIMGTRYRENGYNLENSKDLIDAIENATAEYMDYINYFGELTTIMENFDQSIEVFHPEKWFNMTTTGNIEDDLVASTLSGLYEATDNMSGLADEAEERCRELWKFLLLGDNKEAQTYFLGDISKYSAEILNEALEDVIENIFDIEYENQVQSDAKNFANGIKEFLEGKVEA